MSKSALHLTTFTFIFATGYVTLVSVLTNIGSDLLPANSSHVNVWCLFLYFKDALAVRHSVTLCLAPVQLKQSFLIFLYVQSRFLQFYSQKIYDQVSHSTHINSFV